MSAGPYTPTEDLRILRTAAECLERYLLSSVLYWPVDGSGFARGQSPSLTPGSLLLAQARLGTVTQPPESLAEIEALNGKVAETRSHWASAWARKADREFVERAKLWNNVLREGLNSKPAARSPHLVAQDVRWRVLLELLLPETGDPQKARLLEPADLQLKAQTRPEQFVWPLELQAVFPLPRFWFLYHSF